MTEQQWSEARERLIRSIAADEQQEEDERETCPVCGEAMEESEIDVISRRFICPECFLDSGEPD